MYNTVVHGFGETSYVNSVISNLMQWQYSYYQKYLDIVVNKNDFAVLDSVDGIIRNLHLAREGFL